MYFHVITTVEGVGSIEPEKIEKQMAVLNEKFAAANFKFEWVKTPPTPRSEWFHMRQGSDEEKAAMHDLGRREKDVLNVYTAGAEAHGWAVYPWEYSADPSYRDGVIVCYTTLPDGSETHYNLGMRLVHEVAHWLGLVHTFANGCSEPGDLIGDTAAEYSAAGNCYDPYLDSCPDPDPDPVTNPMDVVIDQCVTGFTPNQSDRMNMIFDNCRRPAQTCGGP